MKSGKMDDETKSVVSLSEKSIVVGFALLAILVGSVGIIPAFASPSVISVQYVSGGKITVAPPSSPTLLNATTVSSTEVDLRWTAPANTGGLQLYGYKIERDNGTGFNQIQNTQSTSYQDTGLVPNTKYSYRVYAVSQAGTSAPSNVATSVTLSSTGAVTGQFTGLSLQEQIKQRSIDAQKIRQSLDGNNTTASLSTSNSSTNSQYLNTGNQSVSSVLPTPTKIPNWVKAVFGYYAQGNLSDGDLINALQFLIKQGIIKVS